MNTDTKLWGMLRLVMGWTFLWAFLDKLFGWGFATESAKSWLAGGSPTMGFLKFAVHGPFAGAFNNLAGKGWVDWLFMIGLLCIGLSLLLGVGVKVAGWSGAVLMLLMWLSLLPPANNPFVDEHVIQFFVLVGLAVTSSKPGSWVGFGKWWSGTGLVQKYRWLE